MWHLSRVAKGETPGVPILLLGHGIGSFAAQLYVLDYSSEMAGLVLSTSGANDRLAGLFTTDPLCFAALQPAALESFLGAAMRLENQFESRKIRKGLPILLISSGEDPVGKSLVGVEELARRYRKAGLGRVTERVYRDGQHDIFDEIQHGQAHRDLLGWLGCVLGPSSSVRQHGPIGERP
jgi:alpha-beta hydrolase superfamily lysophospholipase